MLQATVTRENYVLAIFLAVVAIGLVTATILYLAVDKYYLLYYWDAVSHQVAARKLVDWAKILAWGRSEPYGCPCPTFSCYPSPWSILYLPQVLPAPP